MEEESYADMELVEPSSDAGPIYELQCEGCGQSVRVAESQWWRSVCECGIEWELCLYAKGSKNT